MRAASSRRCARRRGPNRWSSEGGAFARGVPATRWTQLRPIQPSARRLRAPARYASNYTQLFAAARILAWARFARRAARHRIQRRGPGPGRRLRRGPGVALAQLPRPPCARRCCRRSPAESRRRARRRAARRLAAAVAAVIGSQCGCDSVLHVLRPIIGALGGACRRRRRAGSDKPVLGAWLGAVNRQDVKSLWKRAASRTRHAGKRRRCVFVSRAYCNQEWLLEVPPSQLIPAAGSHCGGASASAGAGTRHAGVSGYAGARPRLASSALSPS
jgi:hypothetical protein